MPQTWAFLLDWYTNKTQMRSRVFAHNVQHEPALSVGRHGGTGPNRKHHETPDELSRRKHAALGQHAHAQSCLPLEHANFSAHKSDAQHRTAGGILGES